MPRVIHCSACQRRLQVPDAILGKRIKCPACSETITAEEAGPPPPEASPPAESTVREEGILHKPKTAPRPRWDDEENPKDDYGSRGDDDDCEPRLHRQIKREVSVAGAVYPPAICLIVTGVLGVLINLFQTVICLANPEFVEQNNVFGQGTPMALSAAMGALFAVVAMITIAGAITMMKGKLYGLSMAGAILAMINIGNLCCILGLPFGIWALVVLCRPEVKDSFG